MKLSAILMVIGVVLGNNNKDIFKSLINGSFEEPIDQCINDISIEWLENQFSQAIVGQQLAIKSVVDSIQRKFSGWFDAGHPLVFLFLGSSGNCFKPKANIHFRVDFRDRENRISETIGQTFA